MTVVLTTRGRICPRSAKPLAMLSWGVLCIDTHVYSVDRLGFLFLESPGTCDTQLPFNKTGPSLGRPSLGLSGGPAAVLSGNRKPALVSARPVVVDLKSPGLYNHRAAQLTGARVVMSVGSRELLLSEPEEPTLTSSGTKAPDIFGKC